jgi:glutamine synthetase
VLDELPALTAVICPSAVSYARLQPDHWAGAYACWGVENREAALRLVPGVASKRPQTTNVELKTVDPAANPYLAIGGMIAAGIHGIENNLELPPGTEDNPATLSEEARCTYGVQRLPGSLGEAIERFERSPVLRAAMGDFLFEAFVATRRAEWETHCDQDEESIVRTHRWRY